MRKEIRLLIEGFFDDDIFDVTDINQDIQDIGDQYYNYQVGDIYYENNKPYAVCCGDSKYFMDNNPRFCLFIEQMKTIWRNKNKVIKELNRPINKDDRFLIRNINNYLPIDEKGYENTQIIKNNYNISDFPAFKYCMELGDNVYLPAIDELQILYLNIFVDENNWNYNANGILNKKIKKVLKKKMKFTGRYWSSTQYNSVFSYDINTYGQVDIMTKTSSYGRVKPFFKVNIN